MRSIKATKTKRYADKKPYLPQRELIKGVIYTNLPNYIIDRALKLECAILVKENKKEKVIKPESKELFKNELETKE